MGLCLGLLLGGALPAGAGVTMRVSVTSDGTQGNLWSYGPSLSADGRYVAFASWASTLMPRDTNGTWDVFVHNRTTEVFQPDLQVRTPAEPAYTGDNLYNATGAGQTQSQAVRPGQTATFVFHAQNDGSTADTFTLTPRRLPPGGPCGTSTPPPGPTSPLT